MKCPKCDSHELMIRQKTGLEPILIFLTGLRKYGCLDCGTYFRAPDRRKRPREEGSLAGVGRATNRA